MALQILEIQNGKLKGRRLKVTDSDVLVGRDAGCKVRIASEEVSRLHCRLIATPEGVLVKDLGSSNGTFIDGRPIKGNAMLKPGGQLTIGPMTLRLLGEPAAKPKSDTVRVKPSAKDVTAEEDDIASWLAGEEDDESVEAPVGSDTTIIKNATSKNTPVKHAPLSSMEIPVSDVPVKKREFGSVAEEAEDIFSRWEEMQQTPE
ncbi:MAG: FHA domain-containing protein [Planctomycetaceae bacterium]|nr:FHA domain-containing protein [Planctomycetaceae bacterium]